MYQLERLKSIMNIIDINAEQGKIQESEYIDICNFFREIHDKYLSKNNKQITIHNFAIKDRVLYRLNHLTVVWCTVITKFQNDTKYLIRINDTNTEVREVDQFELYQLQYPNMQNDNIDRSIPYDDIQTDEKIKINIKYLNFIDCHNEIKYKDKIKVLNSLLPITKQMFKFTLNQKESSVLKFCTRAQLNNLYTLERNIRCNNKKEYNDIKKSYREIIGRDIKLCFD